MQFGADDWSLSFVMADQRKGKKGKAKGHQIRYEDVGDEVDLSYDVSVTRVKEEIVLKNLRPTRRRRSALLWRSTG